MPTQRFSVYYLSQFIYMNAATSYHRHQHKMQNFTHGTKICVKKEKTLGFFLNGITLPKKTSMTSSYTLNI